jgi:hypothetical protein
MEPITLCGLVIVMFGFWVELEPAVRAIVKKIRKSKLYSELFICSTVPKSVYVSKMPICLDKVYH